MMGMSMLSASVDILVDDAVVVAVEIALSLLSSRDKYNQLYRNTALIDHISSFTS